MTNTNYALLITFHDTPCDLVASMHLAVVIHYAKCLVFAYYCLWVANENTKCRFSDIDNSSSCISNSSSNIGSSDS